MLHGGGRTPDMEEAWRGWFEASQQNRAAWELATEVYADTAGAQATLPSRADVEEGGLFSRHRVAVVALLALVTLGTVVGVRYWPDSHTISTALGEQRALTFEDGTRVELNTDSRLVERYDGKVRSVRVEKGEVYFNVSHEHEQRPFVVVAAGHAVLALGTEFIVRRDDISAVAPLAVTLIKGSVAVVPTTESSRTIPTANTPGGQKLTHGQRLRFTRDGGSSIDTPSIGQETAWRLGQLDFKNTPLSEAVAEFNRYNKVKLRLGPGVPDSIPVNGTFLSRDLDSFVDSVAPAHGLRVVRHSPTESSQELVLEAYLP